VTGPVPLTPIQQWFFAQGHRRPDHWNQAFLLELRRSVDDAALAGAVAALLEHHDALRHRFLPGEGGWRQVATGPGDLSHSPPPYTRIDLGALPPGRRLDAEEAAAGALQASLDLSGGPLLRCARLGAGEEPGSLLLIVHHLVVDGVSWRILLEDLWTAHEQLRGGGPARLPAKTTSFRAWAERLAEYARSPRLREELPLWRVDASARLAELPFAEGSPAPVSASHTVTVSRSTEETRRLQDLAALYRMGLDEVLLAALARAVQEEAGGALLVAVEGHGREEVFPGVDLSRTVGWFTTLSPVLLDLGGTGDTRSALLRIRERMRRIPDRGLGYGVLRYPGGELDGEPEPAVSFNYLGHLDRLVPGEAPFDLAARGAGPLHDSGTRRSFPLEVGAALFDGQLHVHATCDDRPGHREALERLAERLAAMLSTYAGMSEGADTVEDVYELSPVQQGLLFHALRDPEPGMYFEQLSWTFAGGLRPEVLRRAWQRLLERHPALRASFRWEGLDQPLQMVERSVSLPWEELDWRGLEPPLRGAAASGAGARLRAGPRAAPAPAPGAHGRPRLALRVEPAPHPDGRLVLPGPHGRAVRAVRGGPER
jgi:non-ribosomal peptide synthase protein (TIGR01720 family)